MIKIKKLFATKPAPHSKGTKGPSIIVNMFTYDNSYCKLRGWELNNVDNYHNFFIRIRDPHRENVENILAISLPIVTMQHIRESPSASHAMRISVWNVCLENDFDAQRFCNP